MARHQHKREDLLREATALAERVALEAEDGQPVVIGFRRDASGSIYLGDDLAYHFSHDNKLRRAYVAGELIKAEHGRLVALRRQRTESEVQLLRRNLDSTEQAAWLCELTEQIGRLHRQLSSGQLRVVGQVPQNVDVAARARDWIATLQGQAVVAARPNVH